MCAPAFMNVYERTDGEQASEQIKKEKERKYSGVY